VSVSIAFAEVGVVPVVELRDADDAAPLLDALTAAGCGVAEITLRTDAGLEAISALSRSHPDALIGAGTVLSLEAAERVVEAGARFVVSPATNPEVIAFCRSVNVPVFPGAATATEIDSAMRAGADAVKFFPAEAMGGIAVLKALVLALINKFAGIFLMLSRSSSATSIDVIGVIVAEATHRFASPPPISRFAC